MNNKNLLLKRAKERAKKQSIVVDLSADEITISQYCPILGIELQVNTGYVGGRSNSPSIDRKDNTKGYTKDNVWVISQLANQMKSNATPEQLKAFARWIRQEYGA